MLALAPESFAPADAVRALVRDEALARDVSLFQNASAPITPREVLEVCAERGLAVGGDHARRLARLAGANGPSGSSTGPRR